MREILFRGKDLQERNGWLYGYFYKSDINKRERESGKATLIFTPNCDTCIYVPEYHNAWMVKPETVGQYTGLTDKNGTRIFEGDIVKTSHGGSTYYAKIEWDDGSFWVTNHDIQMPSYISEVSKTYLEVIGNIHDNPELLKGERENG